MPDPYLLGPFAIRPHPLAPLYDNPLEAAKHFRQVVGEARSANFNPNEEAVSLLRQTSLVSLWFFLRCVCSFHGPYDRLSDALSIDMCNVRQSDAWERKGAYAAAFIPRGFFKTSIFTTGGLSWDLLRDPDERIILANATFDKAVEFLQVISSNFGPSSLVSMLFPEHCAFSSKKGQVTDKGLTLPNRTRSYVEPSVKPAGVGGAAEGGHYSRIHMDDLVGLDDLRQGGSSSAAMDAAKRWMSVNLRALRDGEDARTGVVATRYAIDDAYQVTYDSCRSVTGWTKGDLQPREGGKWDVYWRRVEEDGVYLRPDVMSKDSLEELVRTDFWTAMTQYYNEPFKAGLAEFVDYSVGEARLIYEKDEYWLLRVNDNVNPKPAVRLGDCDVVMTVDPAATDSGISAKSCRSSVGVWATDEDDYKYRIWSRVGFFSIHELLDHIFEGNRVFKGVIRMTGVEDNAFQKVLKPLIDREQAERGVWVHCRGLTARGDKKARIRTAFGAYLAKGRIWAVKGAGKELIEELRMFPMSDSRLDVLDESEKGIVYSQRPQGAAERLEREVEEEERGLEVLSAFGYALAAALGAGLWLAAKGLALA